MTNTPSASEMYRSIRFILGFMVKTPANRDRQEAFMADLVAFASKP